MNNAQRRDLLRSLMSGTVANEPSWHYAFRRPLALPSLLEAEKGVVYADCSFGVKDLCHLAGVSDPTGRGYDGYGNSTSIYFHLPHVALAKAAPGDIIVFGSEGSQHAVMVYALGKFTAATVKVWSHGQERGPLFATLAAEAAAHSGAAVTVCRILAPDPPSPAKPHWYANAVAAPPMWSWFAWRDHGAPAGLRPSNVPTKIPLSWWMRYRKHVGAGDP